MLELAELGGLAMHESLLLDAVHPVDSVGVDNSVAVDLVVNLVEVLVLGREGGEEVVSVLDARLLGVAHPNKFYLYLQFVYLSHLHELFRAKLNLMTLLTFTLSSS